MKDKASRILSIRALGIICAYLATSTPVRSIVFDSFDAGPFNLNLSGTSGMVESIDATIPGGVRRVSIELEENFVIPHSDASLQLGEGYLEYQRRQMGHFQIGYGAYAEVPMNMNLNFPDFGYRLTMSAAPNAPEIAVVLTVRDNTFHRASTGREIVLNGSGVYEGSLFTGGIDLTQIGGVRLEIRAVGGNHNGPGIYRFDQLEFVPVPEPRSAATYTGIALLTVAVGMRRWIALRRGEQTPARTLTLYQRSTPSKLEKSSVQSGPFGSGATFCHVAAP